MVALDGNVTRTLTIPHNAIMPLSIGLMGTALPVTLTERKGVSFPATVDGKSSKAVKVTVTNKTAATVTLRTVKPFSGNDFAIVLGSDTCSGATLAKAKKCTVSVEFAPPLLTPAGVVAADAIAYDFIYGSPAINGSVTIVLKGKAK